MPERDAALVITSVEYPLASDGINYWANPNTLKPTEARQSKNLIFKNGMVKKKGSEKLISAEVVASNVINGLHRFYNSTGTAFTFVASDDKVKRLNGTSWTTVHTFSTADQQTTFTTWGALDKCYVANGADTAVSIANDGTTVANITGPNTTGANVVQFISYADRLIALHKNGKISWSGAYDDSTWVQTSTTGVRMDNKLYGGSIHSSTGVDNGYQAKLLLAGEDRMYIFSGQLLNTAIGDYTIQPLMPGVGCISPKTMCWTPKGTIWLGTDKQVYLLPFDSLFPVPIGWKITSNDGDLEGIESVSSSNLNNACAVYHDGYYKLSVAEGTVAYNNEQYWLDVNRLRFDEQGHAGPWYGPMIGMNINCFAVQNGNGDNNELLGGESNSATGSYVYHLNKTAVYQDDTSQMEVLYQTFFNPLTSLELNKDVHRAEIEVLNVQDNFNISINDITGRLIGPFEVDLTSNNVYWNQNKWGTFNWTAGDTTRLLIEPSIPVVGRRFSFLISGNTLNVDFQLYGLRVQANERSQIYER